MTSVSGEEPIERELAELEQEEVRRRVDAAQRAVDVDRRGAGRPLGALREDDLERVALADVLLRALDAAHVLEPSRRSGASVRRPVAPGLEPGQRPVEPLRDLDRVAAQDLGHAQDVVELDERVGDDELALGKVRPGVGQRNGRLELRDVVVAEVADDRLVERLGLLEPDDPRPVADERVAAEASVLDRLEQERGAVLGAQPEVRPERSDEIGGYDGGCVHFGKQKDLRLEVFERNGLVGLDQIRRRSRPARGARSRPRVRSGESSAQG